MIYAQCAVCQECFYGTINCQISALPCGHVFHKMCVETWFKTSLTCPQCRIVIKKSSVIQRLFFDVLENSPVENAFGMTKEDITDDEFDLCKSKSLKSLTRELRRLQMSNMRMEESVKSLKMKNEEALNMINSKDKEISALSTLYSETDKQYEKERQRSRELRSELSSLKHFLKEAEEMKAEAIRLRKETEEMQNIKKLISSSEDAARDLFARYTSKPAQSDQTTNLFALCKWASVLRCELTATRDKCKTYRTELSRIRKLHLVAARRLSRTESEHKKIVATLENCVDDSKAVDESIEDLFVDRSAQKSPNESGKQVNATTTPDVLAKTPQMRTSDSFKETICSPLENPFKVGTLNNNSQTLESHNCKYFFTPHRSTTSTLSSNQRKHSSIFQMSIMRQHLGLSSASTVSKLLPTHPIHHPMPIRSQQPPISNPKRTLKRSISDKIKSTVLDQFILKK